ncbi:hypothetical protein D3Y57_05400 [Sphingomonas paeninsulae]|uniref:Uncharacterized protein n=1 Tax=Sphingomonas paeninsulae TaxID=2319844 RepID=A0A494T878_SPHPE|nr:hypothetical protein D3Y57_05400 [Sphingomonas paeninsulae]
MVIAPAHYQNVKPYVAAPEAFDWSNPTELVSGSYRVKDIIRMGATEVVVRLDGASGGTRYFRKLDGTHVLGKICRLVRKPKAFDWSNPTELVSPLYGRVTHVTTDHPYNKMGAYYTNDAAITRVTFDTGKSWYYVTKTGIYSGNTDTLVRKPLPVAASKEFFVVWRDGGNSPKYRHATYALAVTEAQRLSKVNPGAVFTVLKSVSAVTTPRPPKPPVMETQTTTYA